MKYFKVYITLATELIECEILQDAGEAELRNHKVLLNCDRWTFADYTDPVPTGAIRGVGGTVMDFRIPRILGQYMEKV